MLIQKDLEIGSESEFLESYALFYQTMSPRNVYLMSKYWLYGITVRKIYVGIN